VTTPLPPDIETGALTDGALFGSSTPVWAVTFRPSNVQRSLSSIAIVARPSGVVPTDRLIVWMDTTSLTVAPSGFATEYEPYRPRAIAAGRTIYLVWYSNVDGTPPQATLFTETSVF
jgi:hypothetical protein